MRALIAAIVLGSAAAHGDEAPGVWQPLFNGKDLSGWQALPGGSWTVEDGVIVGRSPQSEARHGLLVSEASYANFVLSAKFRVHSGDSGLYFRATKSGDAVGVHGFQVEVDRTAETGGLYETGGRGWVVRPDPEVIARVAVAGEWTQVSVTAIGDVLTVFLNGVPVAHLADDQAGRKAGQIALQLHGGDEMHVEFKDLFILPLP
jgi:hypothetical protein